MTKKYLMWERYLSLTSDWGWSIRWCRVADVVNQVGRSRSRRWCTTTLHTENGMLIIGLWLPVVSWRMYNTIIFVTDRSSQYFYISSPRWIMAANATEKFSSLSKVLINNIHTASWSRQNIQHLFDTLTPPLWFRLIQPTFCKSIPYHTGNLLLLQVDATNFCKFLMTDCVCHDWRWE